MGEPQLHRFTTISNTQGIWRPLVDKTGLLMKDYFSLIKGLQTVLLLFTALAGYGTVNCPFASLTTLTLAATMFLSVSGSTVLNMVYDEEIDRRMDRTKNRPLPAGRWSTAGALRLGWFSVLVGVGWGALLMPLYGSLLALGVFLDVVVYTLSLKRRTPWSIIWGGMAGGVPVLAGRTLALGYVDAVGILLGLAVLLWIPTHIVTFSIKYEGDYGRAEVPVFPTTHGKKSSRFMVAVAAAGTGMTIFAAAVLLGVSSFALASIAFLGSLLLLMSAYLVFRPSQKLNFILFKFASVFMSSSMGILALG